MDQQEKDLVAKIDILPSLSPKQQDLMNIDNFIKDSLFEWLQGQITKVRNGSRLKQLIEEELIGRVADQEDKMKVSDLIRLYEALSTNQVEREGQLIELLKQESKIQINNNNGNMGATPRSTTNYTAEEYETAKSALTNFNKLLSSSAVQKFLDLIDGQEKQKEEKV